MTKRKKKKNNYLQNNTQKTKDWATWIRQKYEGMNFGVPVMVSNQSSNSDTHLITVYRVIWKPC